MKLGVCGLGMMGQAHLANALKIDGIELAALCDTDPAKLDLSQAVQGNISFQAAGVDVRSVPTFADPGVMLRDAALDAVVLAVPTYRHAELTLKALEAGLHVFVEKPIALTVDEAERVCGAARAAGRLLFVGHVVRFFPAYVKIREMIQSV